ncbi:MAG: ion channel [Propionibacteriaceae bacterium]
MSGLVNAVKSKPSAVLLVVQLLGIVLYPFLETGAHAGVTSGVFGVFGMVVLGLAILAVRPTPALTWISVLLGAPIVVLTVIEMVTHQAQPWHCLNDALHVVFYLWTGLALVRYMFTDTTVSRDEMWATGATFTVFVWAFAYGYSICQYFFPGSFQHELTWMECLFLSGTTMTNTGLSDLVPIRPHARSIVLLQEIAGIFYLGLVVARLTNLGSARDKSTD